MNGFACTGGSATGASNAGSVTGRPWTGGVHGASAAACPGKGGGKLVDGFRIGAGGGCAGKLEDGLRVGIAGPAERGAILCNAGVALRFGSGGRLRLG
ncbi:MAG TPA: hypothetical protein VJV79_19995, partial [Polyangiaceae bacterium]|nr:hypothetical protein [Polyangiaceae bacterium]